MGLVNARDHKAEIARDHKAEILFWRMLWWALNTEMDYRSSSIYVVSN